MKDISLNLRKPSTSRLSTLFNRLHLVNQMLEVVIKYPSVKADLTNHSAALLLPPSAMAELTANELRGYDGSDDSKPIYVSIRSTVFDVTNAKSFYGPGGPYAVFAGREASRALAKMSKSEEDISGELDDLTEKELSVLQDWENKFRAKYPVVGRVV
ncbi:hypothetical protein HPP92_017964 [Vanilla planifolia]|uniref:Cytochrome b5 heme-binding domain-containing protein n=1 Tax=Vanilla planifolia TaxID=51239 RepID=A0A835Q8X9_VANPL|nr:hypothetical protein HPP92_018550 [Vanilla planifolia]KAG0468636.1 hypothetical protein HPP92_017964 [Vanilla planifolia]